MKEFIQKNIVDTNIWVAFCFTAFLLFFQLSLYEVNLYVLGIAFFGTLGIYNFTRVKEISDFWNFPTQNRTRILLTYLGIICTLACVVLRGFEMKTFLYLGVLGFVSFCYSLPFRSLGLRTIPFLKLFLIAFVWAGSSVGLLLVVHHELENYQLLMVSVFFFVVGITIPFDIRDNLTDEKELKTIPQIIGMKKSKFLAVCCLLLSGIFFYWEFKEWNSEVIQWQLSLLIPLVFVLETNNRKSNFYFSFWVEACSLIPLLVYILFAYS